MSFIQSLKLKYCLAIIIGLFINTSSANANEHRLFYKKPAMDDVKRNPKKPHRRTGNTYITQALPMGNGRLGAMFAGGIKREYIVFNDITLWMNTSRGLNDVEQSGTRLNAGKHVETVRKAIRDEKFGNKEGSVESIATEHLSTHTKLGNFASFADLEIITDHDESKTENYHRELNVISGLGKVSYKIGGTNYTREYLCSHPNDVFAAKLTSDGTPMNLKFTVYTDHADHKITSTDNEIHLLGSAQMIKNNTQFMQIVKVETKTGKISAQSNGSITVSGAKDVIVYVTGYSDYLPNYPSFSGRDYEGDSKKTIQTAASLGYDQLKKNHVTDIESMTKRMEFKLDYTPSNTPTNELLAKGSSPELEALYFQYSRYLQLSCSRDAPVPSNLQGLWNTNYIPIWNSDYHTNINIQMNYWMVETANLPESFTPFKEWMKVIAESGQHTAKETFGIDRGWSIGLNSNVFGFTAQNENGRRGQQASHWLSQHLFEHYAFGRDKKYLEEVYPILKGASEFFLDYLTPWKDGSLVVYPTWSSENAFLPKKYGGNNKQAWGASSDQQLIVNLFTDCIEASLILGKDDVFRDELRKMLPKLCPQKIGKHKQVQEWPDDMDDPKNTHRHISQLIALHPGRDFSPLTTPKLSDAALVTLNHRSVMAPEWQTKRHRYQVTGWSLACRVNFWARMHDGEKAYQFYQDLISHRTYQNLFDFHAPFQIDGNFGGAAGVCEMLLQSHLRSIDNNATNISDAAFTAYQEDPENLNNFPAVVPPDTIVDAPYILHLLPALPKAWSKGSMTGLRARGGLTVDISWANNKLTQATIKATTDTHFRIYANGQLSQLKTLKKGESIVWE